MSNARPAVRFCQRKRSVAHLTQDVVDEFSACPHARPAVYDDVISGFHIRQQTHLPSQMFVYTYQYEGRSKWFYIGAASKVKCDDARARAVWAMSQVLDGKDPAGERTQERARRSATRDARHYSQFGRL